MISEILNSKAFDGQTLKKYVEENCAENGFDESLKSFKQFLSEKSIEQEIVSQDLEISESPIETDENVDERKSLPIESSEKARKCCCLL